jgi:hypothetical protein
VNIRSIAAAVTCALLVACGTVGPGQLATVTNTYTEAAGDVNSSASGTQYDVTKLVTRRIDNPPFGSYDTLQIEVTFAQNVVLPAPGGPPDSAGTNLTLQVGLDTDQNPTTGTTLNCPAGNGGNGSWPGNDYYVLESGQPGQGRLPNGNFVVQNAAGTAVGEAVVSVSGKVLTMNISLSTLGGDDGIAEVRGAFGNFFSTTWNYTDCAPNPLGSVVTRK